MIRSTAPERRYAILAEGRSADSSAKTAHGLIRYGKDEVVCVMDSTLAGKRVAEVMPDRARPPQALAELRRLYGQFEEGFATPDLVAARALLGRS